MLAIDTSVVVRYLTGDHPEQSARARDLIVAEEVFVGTTVLLEAEWVLRGAYGFGKEEVVRALRAFAGLPRVTVEDAPRAAQALDWAEAGLDFADALHLAGGRTCEAFVSFDRRFVRQAGKIPRMEVREP